MRLFWTILIISLAVGCASPPKKIILAHEDPAQVTVTRNWAQQVWFEAKQHISLTTRKGLQWKSHDGDVEVEVGKVRILNSKRTRLADAILPEGVKKRWGVKVTLWFKERFLL